MLSAAALVTAPGAEPQSRIKAMPGYDRWAEAGPKIPRALISAAITPKWAEDSSSFTYEFNGKSYRFDIASLQAAETGAADQKPPVSPENRPLVLARGRGGETDVKSPDGKWRAFTRDRNLWLVPTNGGEEKQLSTDGSVEKRIRHGVGSYIYLEEFSVSAPVHWSPDSNRIAWMRYDEREVDDYFLALDQTKTFSKLLTQAYPHPGAKNPVPDLYVHDRTTGKSVRMDVRMGAAFTDDVVGHYVWDGIWTRDSSEILIRRADRLQKVQDLVACNPSTGACRILVREERPGAWANTFAPFLLSDGKHFIWTSDRTGYRNLYLYGLDGKLKTTLTRHRFDVEAPVHADAKRGVAWYLARSGDNHMKMQLHRVGLDGRNDRRLTDPKLHHRITPAPDGRHFVDIAEAHDTPPTAALRDANGKALVTFLRSDRTQFDALGLKHPELFTFTSADGKTELHGLLHRPSSFDPAKKYPVLFSLYGGPESNAAREEFLAPNPLTEFGFLVAQLDARTAEGKGRAILDSTYRQLGVVEIDDFAAGARALAARPYVDRERMGVFGTSYGGTVAALMLMRHPDLIKAASSSSPVADFRLYDTAYTERYLGLPASNVDAYDRVSVLRHIDKLQGDLLIFFGTSDDNVHPKNALQLIQALQTASKSFEVQVGPDRGHTSVNPQRMMEFFIERLGPGVGVEAGSAKPDRASPAADLPARDGDAAIRSGAN